MKGQTNAFARSRAKQLRLDGTDCERLLWRRLRGEQLGVKFRRQHPLDQFIVDFVCLERRLIVELDGGQHLEAASSDQRRSGHLAKAGFRVLRFWNHDILEAIDVVLDVIHRALQVEERAATLNPIPTLALPLKGRESVPLLREDLHDD